MNEVQEQKDETLSVCSAPDAQSQKEHMDVIDGEEDNDDSFTLSTLSDEESDEDLPEGM